MKRFFLLCLVLSAGLNVLMAQESPIRVAFWNVESFFDPFVDSTSAYNDFTEDGIQHWTKSRFYRKRNNLYKTILALSENRPIGIMGLCEVENEYVLTSLFAYTPLKSHRYRWVHYEGPDRRGTEPALVYSLDHFMLVESAVFPYYNPEEPEYRSRDILYAKFIPVNPKGAGDRGSLPAMTPSGTSEAPEPVEGPSDTDEVPEPVEEPSNTVEAPEPAVAEQGRSVEGPIDTIHVFVNHWPSRYSGELETFKARTCAATILREKVDSIIASYPKDYAPKILIMGDLNDTPEDPSVHDILKARSVNEQDGDCLINLFATKDLGFEGTLKHQADWQVFDQIIVTPALMQSGGGLHYQSGSAAIFHAPFLLEDDPIWHGQKPYRTALGPRYIGGFSDHLPVYIDLILGCPDGQK